VGWDQSNHDKEEKRKEKNKETHTSSP